jgi:hypothetical protein
MATKTPRTRKVFQIDLTDPRFSGVFLYAQSLYPGEPTQAAIYELLQIAISEIYKDAAIMAARRHAFAMVKRETLRRVFSVLEETCKEVLNSDAVTEVQE